MSEDNNSEKKLTEIEWHRKMAAQLFNQTWDLIEKGDKRTSVEDESMIHSAHASRYHWEVVVNSGKYPKTGPINLERGDWQISRVYSMLKRPIAAKYHAKQCLTICKENKIGDFDIAFAYEALARAASLEGDKNYQELHKKAREYGNQISKEDDKKYFFSELESIKSVS
ncbi:MAG: hypothetical protein ACW99F_07285 [Candidatus Hodarchaeales archaeon]|jgi:stress-induced morphogen